MEITLKKRITQAVVIPDIHAPSHNEDAVLCVIDYIQKNKPDIIILIGDVADFASVARWNKGKGLLLEGKRIQLDIDSFLDILKRFKAAAPSAKKIVLFGNHEDRLRRYLEENPVFDGLRSMNLYKLSRDYGYLPIPYGDRLKIGKLLFEHGKYTNEFHAKKSLLRVGHSIVYGHTHSHQLYSMATYEEDDALPQEKDAESIGCLCDMNPAYMRNRDKNWTHGFATIGFYRKGLYFKSFHKILNGITIIDGKMYSGKNVKQGGKNVQKSVKQ